MENIVRFALLILLTISRPSPINAKASCVVPNKKIFCKIRTEIQNSVELLERSKFDFCLCTHVVVGLEKFKNKLQVDRNQNELFRYLGRKRAVDATFPKIMASIRMGDDFNSEKLQEEVQFLLGRIDLDGVELDYDSNNTRLILPIVKNVRSNATNKIITMSLSAKLMNTTQNDNFREITRYLNMVVIQPIFYSYAKINKNREDFRRISDLETLASVIDDVLSWGIPKHKVLVTLSTFGIRTELNPSTGSIKSSIRIPYSEICIDRRDRNWTLQREMDQTSPFITKENIRQAFDDEISLKLKSKYILLRKLGGVQISSIHEDDHSDFCKRGHYPLIRSIHQVISGVKSNKSSIDDLQEYMEPSETKMFIKKSGELPPDLPCSRVGYYQNPYDCNKFYRCVKFHSFSTDFTIFHYECPHGLIFDERYEVCNWPSWSDRCAGSGEVVNVPKNRFVCPGTGYFRDRENCRWFYYCSEVYYDNDVPSAYEFKCPYNLAYDEERHICNWRWLVPGCGIEWSDKWNSQNPLLPKELGVVYEKPEKGHAFIDHDFGKFLQKPDKQPIVPIDPDFDKFQRKPDKEPIISIDPDVDKLVFDNPSKGSIIPNDPDFDKLVHFSKFNKPDLTPEPDPEPEPEPKFKHPSFKPPNLSTGFNLEKNKEFIPDSNPFEGIEKLPKPFDETYEEPKSKTINPLFGIPDEHQLAKPNHYPTISHHSKTSDHSHHSSSFDRMRNLFRGLVSLISTRPTISLRNILSQGIVSHLSKLFSGHHHDSFLTIPLLEEKSHSTSLQPPSPPVNIFIINNGNKFEKITPHILTSEKLPYKPPIKHEFLKEYIPPPPPVEPEPPIKNISPPIEPEPPIKDIPPPIEPEPQTEDIPPPDDLEPPIKELPPPKRPEKQIYYGPPDILPLPPRPEIVKPIIPPQSEEFKPIRPRPLKYYNQEQNFPNPPARPEPKPNKYFSFKDIPEDIPPEPEPVQINKYENDCKDDKEIPPFSKHKYEKFEEIYVRPQPRPEPIPERIPLPPKYKNSYESKPQSFSRPEPDPEIIPQPPKYKFHSYEGITRPYFRPEPEPKEASYLSKYKFQNYGEIPPKSFSRPIPEPVAEDIPEPPKYKYQSYVPRPEPLPENIPSLKNKYQDYEVVRAEPIPEESPSPPKFKYQSYVPRPESTPDEIPPFEKQIKYHNYKEKFVEQRPDTEDISPELERYKYKSIPEKSSKGQDNNEYRYPPTDRQTDPDPDSINELGPKFELDYYSKTACTRPGLFRHPGNCYKFYECYWDKWINKFTLHMFDCPIKLIFDEKILGCSSPKVNIPCKGYK